MEINEAFVLQSIDLPALTDIARQALGVGEVEIENWRMNQIAGGIGNPVSVGLYRVAGNGRAGGERVPWSVILKIIQSPANVGESNIGEGDDQTHWNYWKRELLVYRSSFLNSLPDGLVAPHCYATNELPGDFALLWLEDVVDACENAWPLERYTLAARHLGRLNGLNVGVKSSLDYPWLGRRRLRQWYDLFPNWRTIPWDHPQVSARYPANEISNLRRMLVEAEAFIDQLDRLPQTVCHGDTYPTNFMSRGKDGDEQTVALDWALAQVGPIGFDLGGLIFGAYLNLPQRSLVEVDRTLFAAYLSGLRDYGCQTDSQHVRFAYATAAALLISLFVLGIMDWQIKSASATELDAAKPNDGRPCFEAFMADIAYELRALI
jgi:hypothetical protein